MPLAAAPAMQTLFGPMHVGCGSASMPAGSTDMVPNRWIALIYAVTFVPFVQPISFMVRRMLMLTWADRYPRRVATLRFHGQVADAMAFAVIIMTFLALVAWLVLRA
jgi:hypothetical protein